MIKRLLESTQSIRNLLLEQLDPTTDEAFRLWTGLDKEVMQYADKTGRGSDRKIVYLNAIYSLFPTLPKYKGKVRMYFNNIPDWKVGHTVEWKNLESGTTLKPSQVMRGKLKGFEKFRAMLIIQNSSSGADISKYSNYPDEEEILFLKGLKVRITDRIETDPNSGDDFTGVRFIGVEI